MAEIKPKTLISSNAEKANRLSELTLVNITYYNENKIRMHSHKHVFPWESASDYPSFGAIHVFEIVRLGALFRILLPSPSKVHPKNRKEELKIPSGIRF